MSFSNVDQDGKASLSEISPVPLNLLRVLIKKVNSIYKTILFNYWQEKDPL